MTGSPRPWALCGGWAIDAWLGRQTRYHADIDIAVFEPDLEAIRQHLHGWTLIAHDEDDPDSTTPWTGRPLRLPAHIHAGDSRDFHLEVVVSRRLGTAWILHEDPVVSLPLAGSIRPSPWRLPTASPEVLLFYKATAYYEEVGSERPQDAIDFFALLPNLNPQRQLVVRNAVSVVYPDHAWLMRIDSSPR